MDHRDSDYFKRRAKEEKAAAARAGDDRARQSHRDLAKRYTEAARAGAVADAAVIEQGGWPIGPEFRIID